MIEKILAHASRYAHQAEVFYEEREGMHIKFRNNILDFVGAKHLRGVSLRVIRDNKLGFSSISSAELHQEESTKQLQIIRKLVNNAIATLRFGHTARFCFPTKIKGTAVHVFDSRLDEMDEKECIAIGEQIIDTINRFNYKIKSDVEIQKMNNIVCITNSKDKSYSYTKTMMNIEITSSINLRGSVMEIYDSCSSCSRIDYEKLVENICNEMEMLISLKTQKADSGPTTILFMPKAMYPLLYPLKVAINGKFVCKRFSRWTNDIGERVASEKINVFDDGTVKFAPGSAPIDDEGISTQRTTIIEQGILKNFIHDLQTAGETQTKPTGNGLRAFLTPPSSSPTNLIIESDELSLSSIIEGLDDGILVNQVLGVGQTNVFDGSFLVDINLGFQVKKGKINSRVKNSVVSGNIFDAFDSVQALSRETEYKYGAQTPAFCFSRMLVKTK